MKKVLVLCALAGTTALFNVGCTQEGIEPTLTSIQSVLIDRSCNSESCHGGSTPEAGLDLSTAQASYDSLVGVASSQEPSFTLVTPGDPDNSLLYMVLTGEVGSVDQMPPGYSLDPEEIEAVRQWIEDGAENN